jgi:hypothetical protein
MEKSLRDLPEGYTIKYSRAIGYSFINPEGIVVVQHPKDNDAIRSLVWTIHRNMEKEGL